MISNHKKNLEDISVKNKIEKILKDKRGYILKWPSKLEHVIVLISGGMDSVSVISILIEKYGVIVHPLFIKRGQKRERQELSAARYYIKLFQKKYDKNCQNLNIIKSYIPPKKIRWTLTSRSNERINKKLRQLRGIPIYLQALTTIAVQYALYLEIKNKVHVRSIFLGFISSDGKVMSYETLTALRTQTLNISILQNDYSWQIISPFLDNNKKTPLEKNYGIKWLTDHKINPCKTWSCYYAHKYHCGVCSGCVIRKKHFKIAKIKDETIYRYPSLIKRFFMKLLKKINYEKYNEIYF